MEVGYICVSMLTSNTLSFMQLPRYDHYTDESKTVFEFVSTGPKGCIRKLVEYVDTGSGNLYNLGFGDINENDGRIDDTIVSNNGDRQKVLATVAATVDEFTSNYPHAIIFATGSTDARTRLYRIGIHRHLLEIQDKFAIFGYCKINYWEEFTRGKDYLAFLLTRKENRQTLWQRLQILNQMNQMEG